MMIRICMVALALMFVAGCAGTTSQSFDVRVKNESSQPITVWLTKDGPPFEPKWASPEEIATERPGGSDTYLGVIVPPTKSGETGSVEAILQPETNAWLRIYSGAEKFSELLAMSKGNPNRLDIKLEPGINSYVVKDSPGGIVASRVDAPAP